MKGFSYYGEKCISKCTKQGSVSYKCSTEESFFQQKCSPKKPTKDIISKNGSKCLDECDYYDQNYQWCNTGTGLTSYLWDKCSFD